MPFASTFADQPSISPFNQGILFIRTILDFNYLLSFPQLSPPLPPFILLSLMLLLSLLLILLPPPLSGVSVEVGLLLFPLQIRVVSSPLYSLSPSFPSFHFLPILNFPVPFPFFGDNILELFIAGIYRFLKLFANLYFFLTETVKTSILLHYFSCPLLHFLSMSL